MAKAVFVTSNITSLVYRLRLLFSRRSDPLPPGFLRPGVASLLPFGRSGVFFFVSVLKNLFNEMVETCEKRQFLKKNEKSLFNLLTGQK